MGLLQLRYIERNIEKERELYNLQIKIKDMAQIRTIDINSNVKYNYAYMPIFLKTVQTEKAYNDLIKKGIHCRKYWYPLITSHDIYSSIKKLI